MKFMLIIADLFSVCLSVSICCVNWWMAEIKFFNGRWMWRLRKINTIKYLFLFGRRQKNAFIDRDERLNKVFVMLKFINKKMNWIERMFFWVFIQMWPEFLESVVLYFIGFSVIKIASHISSIYICISSGVVCVHFMVTSFYTFSPFNHIINNDRDYNSNKLLFVPFSKQKAGSLCRKKLTSSQQHT